MEPRRYCIYKTHSEVVVLNGVLQFVPERVWCRLHRLEGSVEEIPMRVTTIEEMVKSGLQADYWTELRRRQLVQITRTEQLVAKIAVKSTLLGRAKPDWLAHFESSEQLKALSAPRDLKGWEAVLGSMRHGKTDADYGGLQAVSGQLDTRAPVAPLRWAPQRDQHLFGEQQIYITCDENVQDCNES